MSVFLHRIKCCWVVPSPVISAKCIMKEKKMELRHSLISMKPKKIY